MPDAIGRICEGTGGLLRRTIAPVDIPHGTISAAEDIAQKVSCFSPYIYGLHISASPNMNASKKPAIGFIFITLLIDITGWGLIIPVMPKLIEQLINGDVSTAARWAGWLGFAYAITQFLFAPVIGSLSDQFGRRPVLLFSLFGFGIDYILLALAPTIGWLFLGRIIAGITGASITTASAYIADISNAETLAKNFGMIGAAFGVGFILGPVLGGLLGSFGPRVPFWTAAILCLLNWLYGYFVLPESLAKENRRAFSWSSAIPFKSLLNLRKYPSIVGLIFSLVLVYVAAHAVQSNWSFYGIERFQWNERMIGISLGVIGLLVGAVQGGLVRIVNPKIGNEKSVYIGLMLYAIGMTLFGLATHTWMMFIFLVPYCLGGICGPALQSIISGQVPPNQQGELQGALASLMSATAIIGPPLMTNTFAHFTQKNAPIYLPGAPFFLASFLMLVSAVLAYRSLHPSRQVSMHV
jgi:DHA1 family tetracycline resistance protein-like MFS transporter